MKRGREPATRLATNPETGCRRDEHYCSLISNGFRSHPDLRLVKDGHWSDYDKTPRFALQRGHRLYGAALDLGIAVAAMAGFDTLRVGLADETDPGPRFLGGHPGRR
jgi:hypothetical protein